MDDFLLPIVFISVSELLITFCSNLGGKGGGGGEKGGGEEEEGKKKSKSARKGVVDWVLLQSIFDS